MIQTNDQNDSRRIPHFITSREFRYEATPIESDSTAKYAGNFIPNVDVWIYLDTRTRGKYSKT